MEKDENFFNGFDDDILVDDDFKEDDGSKGDGNKTGDGNDSGSDDTSKKTQVDSGDDKADSSKDDNKAENVNSGDSKSKEENANEAELKAKEAEKNAKYAEMRRKDEAEAKARQQKEAEEKRIREDATLKAELGAYKLNAYTNEPIVDENDLNIFKIQKQLDEEGKDPIKDLPKRMAELERQRTEEAKKLAEEKRVAQEKLDAQAKVEVKELHEAHPKLDIPNLLNDPVWVEAFNKDGGRLTLKEIYEYKYLPKKESYSKVNSKEDENVEKSAKQVTKTPSSQSNGGKTSKNYLEMSDEEYLAHERKNRNEDFF